MEANAAPNKEENCEGMAKFGAEVGQNKESMELDRDKIREALEGVEHTEVILYGSYAYGQPGPESDVDILVVGDGVGIRQEAELGERLEKILGVEVDLQVFSTKRMVKDAKWSTMIPDAVTRGIVLSPEGREHSIYEELAKEWSASATARFYVGMVESGRANLHLYEEKLDADEGGSKKEAKEDQQWSRILVEGKAAGLVRQAMWALLWSLDEDFSKQDVAKLSGEGKWAHWSLPALLKALNKVAPESYEQVGPAGEALLAKEAWREMFKDTKASQNTLKQRLPGSETKELVAKTEVFLGLVIKEVHLNLEKRDKQEVGEQTLV